MAKKTYVVKKEDNLASLSKKLGTSIPEIQKANGIRNLTPGQTLVIPASRSNGVGASGNAGGYSVTTGPNERKTITYNGTDIRMGPNSTFAPKNEKSKFQQFIDVITGNAPSQPSGTTSVRGALPSSTKGIPGLAAPTQYQNRLGTSTTAGGLSTQFQGFLQNFQNVMSGQYSGNGYSQQSMAPGSLTGVPLQSNNPVTSSLVLGTNMPTYYQGPGKGINGSPMPVQNQGNGLGVNSQIGGYQQVNQQTYFGSYGQGAPFSANQNMLRQQALGIQPQAPVQLPGRYNPMAAVPQQNMLQQNAQNVFTGLSNNANIGPMRAPNTFSYAPQGQPNSYTPYSRQGAPFLTSAMMANPTYGNAPTAPKTNYGSYANGTAITAQESFQQGNKNVGKRWWIGRNRQDDGGAAAAALAAQQAAELAANQAITMNTGSVQQATWRPVY